MKPFPNLILSSRSYLSYSRGPLLRPMRHVRHTTTQRLTLPQASPVRHGFIGAAIGVLMTTLFVSQVNLRQDARSTETTLVNPGSSISFALRYADAQTQLKV